jgi:hypothetical protein
MFLFLKSMFLPLRPHLEELEKGMVSKAIMQHIFIRGPNVLMS